MPALPVLCSGCLWAGYCADSACCEVSFNCTFVCLCLLLLWFWFLCIFAAVGCWCILDGSASWCCFGGLSSLRWSTWFGACWVTAFLCYLLSSNRDDSFQKTKASLPFCHANRARTVSTCMCLFCFISRNENNNGFDAIGLNFLFLTKSVWQRLILMLYFALFSLVDCFRMGEIFCIMSTIWRRKLELSLHVNMRGRLCYEWDFEVAVFLNIFCNNCYHQIEMISFIKLFSCHSVFPAAAHADEVSFCWIT